MPPAFAAQTIRSPDRTRPECPRPERRSPHAVLLFPDTFTNYHEPEIGLAAVELLQRAGCAVADRPAPRTIRCALLRPSADLRTACSTRPSRMPGTTSRGSNAGPRGEADHRLRAELHPHDQGRLSRAASRRGASPGRDGRGSVPDVRGVPRVGPRRKRRGLAEARPALVWSYDSGRVRSTILVQGHCHQRSLVGMGPLLRLLRRVPGAEVVDLDAGCCGMAGSFGYENEHYEVSRLVGEQRLFPAVRRAAPDAAVVAPDSRAGSRSSTSPSATALHPAQLLRGLVGNNLPNSKFKGP